MRVCVAVALLALTAGCASPITVPPEEPAPGERQTYVIGVPDQLRISVWKNPELGGLVPVRPDGKISVALLDDVQAEGLTPEELKEILTQKLSEYIANPDVTVTVVATNSHTVSVIGRGIARNGVVAVNREMRVLEAIAQSGGFTAWADRNNVRILRNTPQGMVTYRYSHKRFLAGDDPKSNLVLLPGDTIVVSD